MGQSPMIRCVTATELYLRARIERLQDMLDDLERCNQDLRTIHAMLEQPITDSEIGTSLHFTDQRS